MTTTRAEYRVRSLIYVLAIGGFFGLINPLVTSMERTPIRGWVTCAFGLVLLVHALVLYRTNAVRQIMISAVIVSTLFFNFIFLLFGTPFYLAFGFAIPVCAAMYMRTVDAIVVLVFYCVVGLSVAALFALDLITARYAQYFGFELGTETVNFVIVLSIVSGVTIWKERLFHSSTESQRIQRQRFGAVFENGYAGILDLNSRGVITFADGHLLAKMGYESSDLVGRLPTRFVNREDKRVISTNLRNFDDHYRYDREIRAITADGAERWVRLSGGSYDGPQGEQNWVMAIQDIHDQVIQRHRVYDLSRLESLGTICGGIAHDFNNVLTVIGFQSELIEDKEVRKVISLAQQQAADLTSGLLSFARKQEYRDRNLSMSQFFDESRRLVERMLPANVRCEWAIEPADAVVRADPSQLQQTLINLVTNAWHAMPDGGRLRICGERVVSVPGESGGSPVTRPNGFYCVSVSDTGFGMDQKTLSRAIEPFFTTKARGVGTGLGLAAVHGVVGRASGELRISSEVGVGSTVSIYLPLVLEPRRAANRLSSIPVEHKRFGANRHLMIVDDREILAEAVQSALAKTGFLVTVKHDAEQAWDELRRRDDIEFLVSDIVLPGMSGVDLVGRVLQEKPQIRSVMISGHQQHGLSIVEENPERIRFLPKPFSSSELLQALEELSQN